MRIDTVQASLLRSSLRGRECRTWLKQDSCATRRRSWTWHGRCLDHGAPNRATEIAMTDQSLSLALGVSMLFFEFAVDLALTGDTDRAFQLISARRDSGQDDEGFDNLLWD